MSTNPEIQMPAAQSLYDHLTSTSTPELSPLVSAAMTFIQAIARNTCRAKRNVQTLCRIARRACEICDTVNQQLSWASEEMDLEVMENCGNVVEKLEQLLSDVLVLSTDELVANLDSSVQRWGRNRDTLSEILHSLYHPPFHTAEYAWNEDLLTSRWHDDIVWIDQVSDSIEQHSSEGDNQVSISKFVVEMKSALRKIPLTPGDTTADAAMTLTTKCLMRTFSAIKRPEDTESKGPIKQTWDPKHLNFAKGIMKNLVTSVKSSASEVDNLQIQWDKLEASILFGMDPMPPASRGLEKSMYRCTTVFKANKGTVASSSAHHIKCNEIYPGYLVSQQIEDPDTTIIHDLSMVRDDVILPLASRSLAINEARKMLAYCIGDDKKSYVRLAPIPFDTSRPASEIEIEGKPVYIFWINQSVIGLLNENGDFYTVAVSSDNRRTVLKPARWLFSSSERSVIDRDSLCLSMVTDSDELAWLAFNTMVDDLPQVQVWSQKARRLVVMDGMGTLTSTTIDGESHTLLATTAPTSNDSLWFTIYALDERLPNRPFPIKRTEIPLALKNGMPSFIHVFQPQGVAFVVVRSQHVAHAILCDIHTGFRLQVTERAPSLLGSFSAEGFGKAGTGKGVLVLHTETNTVERITISEEILKALRVECLSIGGQ